MKRIVMFTAVMLMALTVNSTEMAKKSSPEQLDTKKTVLTQHKWDPETVQSLKILAITLLQSRGRDTVGDPAFDRLNVIGGTKVKILSFKTKVTNRVGNIVKVTSLVKILNPNRESLEVCINFLDNDEFAIEQFCRTTMFTSSKFQQKADTTIFRCGRTFNENGWSNSTVSVKIK